MKTAPAHLVSTQAVVGNFQVVGILHEARDSNLLEVLGFVAGYVEGAQPVFLAVPMGLHSGERIHILQGLRVAVERIGDAVQVVAILNRIPQPVR